MKGCNTPEEFALFCETHLRRGWCGACGEVPITTRPAGHNRMWFCKRCGHYLGEEPGKQAPTREGGSAAH